MEATSMDRESKGCLIVGVYCSVFFLVDVWRQVTSYGVKYVNNNTYPIHQTAIVALTESFKFVVFCGLFIHERGTIKLSILYAVPSLVYAMNNNVYYYAMYYTTPPIWNIIIQLRIVFTALTYRIVFKRYMSTSKCTGIALLICAIVLTNVSMGEEEDQADEKKSGQLLMAFILAGFGSITSAIGAIVMEYMYKNDKQSFSAQQTQLYLYSTLASWLLFTYESSTVTANVTGEPMRIYSVVVACILLSSASGIVVALIVKKLDNMVKLYAQAVANTLTSIACAFFFPDQFQFSFHFFLCLMLMIVAVFIYESDIIIWSKLFNIHRSPQHKPKPYLV